MVQYDVQIFILHLEPAAEPAKLTNMINNS